MKRMIIIKTITIFFGIFLFHFGYKVFPNFLTSILFPVNESLFEHLKLIFVTEVIVSLIIYIIYKKKNILINNYFLALFSATIFNIIAFYAIYLPIYYRFGQSLIVTMIIYFITLGISQYLFYRIITRTFKKNYNKISLIILLLIWLILIYFTFNPLKNDFFFDPIAEIYGIPNK